MSETNDYYEEYVKMKAKYLAKKAEFNQNGGAGETAEAMVDRKLWRKRYHEMKAKYKASLKKIGGGEGDQNNAMMDEGEKSADVDMRPADVDDDDEDVDMRPADDDDIRPDNDDDEDVDMRPADDDVMIPAEDDDMINNGINIEEDDMAMEGDDDQGENWKQKYIDMKKAYQAKKAELKEKNNKSGGGENWKQKYINMKKAYQARKAELGL